MTTPEESIGRFDELEALEKAFRGLNDAARFDVELNATRETLKVRLAELVISDELEEEIDGMTGMRQAVAGQTVSEICNDIFGSEDYSCKWEESKQWLVDAMQTATDPDTEELRLKQRMIERMKADYPELYEEKLASGMLNDPMAITPLCLIMDVKDAHQKAIASHQALKTE